MKTVYRTIWMLLVVLLTGVSVAVAQGTCSVQVETALEELEQTCAGLGRNTVCYGNTEVQATFADTPLDLQFAVPSDRIALNFMAGLRAGPLDEEAETWGLAVMNTQANLPGALPGQGVVMLVMGDTEITSEKIAYTPKLLSKFAAELYVHDFDVASLEARELFRKEMQAKNINLNPNETRTVSTM
ncbi:MAG: hypothetical protein AAFR56_08470, partial [Chloroflexota bacterium]